MTSSSAAAPPGRRSSFELDIVIPFFNEADVLPVLFDRLDGVFTADATAHHGIARVRYLMVDDGSSDRSASLVSDYIAVGGRCTLVRLSRNFGHQNAVSAGLDRATGDAVAVLDADLQDPPELLLEMLARWRDGFDVVYAQRRGRKESALKRLGYWSFYRLVSFLSEMDMPLDAGDFCLMDRRVVEAIRALPEKLRVPRILRSWVGFRQTGVAYDRPERSAGRSKYGLAMLYNLATDGIASSSTRPLQVAQLMSFSFAVLTIVLVVALLSSVRSFTDDRLVLLFISLAILVAGGNFVVTACLYILGAYVGRAYLEVKGRPAYVVLQVLEGTGTGAVAARGDARSPIAAPNGAGSTTSPARFSGTR